MTTIRKIKPTELKILQVLNNEVFKDNLKYDDDLDMDWPYSPKGEEYYNGILSDPEAICLVAQQDGKPVGYIAGRGKKVSYRKSKYYEIENMGVIEDSRRKGIGKMLVDEFVKKAKEKGFQRLYVNAYDQNAKAIAFYKSCAFTEIDISFEKEL